MSKQNKFKEWLSNPAADIWIFIIFIVLLNLVAARAFTRFDLTSSKAYTLSRASKQTVRTLEENLSIKVFFSDNLPAEAENVHQYVQDIVSEYKTAGKKISVESYNMNSPENQKLARNYGLNQVQIQEIRNNEIGAKSVYMGLVLTYADQMEKIDQISEENGLEYKITSTINRLVKNTNALPLLKENLSLTFYKTEDFKDFGIMDFENLDEYVKECYAAANKKYRSRITYETVNPTSEQVLELKDKFGIPVNSWKDFDGKAKYGTICLVLENDDQFKMIPLTIASGLFGYQIDGLEGLDETIEKSVETLVSSTSVVAYVTGHGELDIDDSQNGAGNFAGLLDDRYSFRNVNLKDEDIPFGVQTLMINGPNQEFDEAELYKIDQFLMKGGNLYINIDPFDEIMPDQQMRMYGMAPQYVPTETGLEKLLEKYGFKTQNAIVMDKECLTHNDRQYGNLTYYYAPVLQKTTINQKHDISRNLSSLLFYSCGTIDPEQAMLNSNATVAVLAQSSKNSWLLSENVNLNPMYADVPGSPDEFKSYPLAVYAEGKFESYFNSKVPAEASGAQETSELSSGGSSHISSSLQKGKIFVCGSSAVTSYMLIAENSNQPIAYFMENALDYLNGNEDLCIMRSKEVSSARLHTTTGALVLLAQYFNEFGLTVIVIIIGLLVYISRRKHRYAVRMKYNPEDSREISSKKSEETK